MSNTLPEFREKFRLDDLTILTSTHWTWSVRPVHSTLGAGILCLNRFCANFGGMTQDESADLSVIVNEIETKLTKSFAPEKFNYVMLMMVDRHLHFHVIPRYSAPKQFGGLTWEDQGWPALPQLGAYADLATNSVLGEIRSMLANA